MLQTLCVLGVKGIFIYVQKSIRPAVKPLSLSHSLSLSLSLSEKIPASG